MFLLPDTARAGRYNASFVSATRSTALPTNSQRQF